MREKPGTPNSQRRIERRGIAARELDAGREPARSTTRRAVSSISAEMSMPKNCAVGPGARRGDQVARRAAADLEHPAAGGRREAVDQAVAAEQVVFARQIVEMPLPAIDRGPSGPSRGGDRSRQPSRT